MWLVLLVTAYAAECDGAALQTEVENASPVAIARAYQRSPSATRKSASGRAKGFQDVGGQRRKRQLARAERGCARRCERLARPTRPRREDQHPHTGAQSNTTPSPTGRCSRTKRGVLDGPLVNEVWPAERRPYRRC